MSRSRIAAFAAAAVLVTGSFAAAQSDNVTLTLSRATAQELQTALEQALGTTTTTGGTTTTVGVTTTTLPATTTTTSPPPTTTTTVTSPPGACSGVQVPSGANLVTIANAHSAGQTFCLAPGTYLIPSSITFETGDRWFGALAQDGTRLSIITGNGSTPYLVTATSSNVLLANVIVERFNNATQQGVNTGSQTSWTFLNVEVRDNVGHGLHTHNGTQVRNSYIHHNHQMGMGGNGDNVLVENNEISYNNWLAENVPGFEAGGTKWVNSVGLTLRGNFVHHNCGNGLWVDGGSSNVLMENNVAEDNWAAGLNSELNPGPNIVIRNNVVNRNAHGQGGGVCTAAGGGGAGGIRVNDSTGVEVYGNVLVDNEGGISSVDGSRTPNVTGLYVHDNDITWTDGRHGLQDTAAGSGEPFTGTANNRYRNNTYHYNGSDPSPFQWAGNKSWAQWQAAGQDPTGTFD